MRCSAWRVAPAIVAGALAVLPLTAARAQGKQPPAKVEKKAPPPEAAPEAAEPEEEVVVDDELFENALRELRDNNFTEAAAGFWTFVDFLRSRETCADCFQLTESLWAIKYCAKLVWLGKQKSLEFMSHQIGMEA